VNFSYTSLFYRSYGSLKGDQQGQIAKAILRLSGHPSPPYPAGWRVHKLVGVKGTSEKKEDPPPDVWEMHAPGSGALVVTFQRARNSILFRNCGLHDKTLQSP
jgi:hypothetical protein